MLTVIRYSNNKIKFVLSIPKYLHVQNPSFSKGIMVYRLKISVSVKHSLRKQEDLNWDNPFSSKY